MNMSEKEISDKEAVAAARRVTWVGFGCNAVLAVIKVIAGLAGRSGALVADGVHSFSDFITDVIVLVMVGVSRRKPDSRYQYGRGKYETFATMLIAIALVVVGIGIFGEGLRCVIEVVDGGTIARPGWVALVICVVSIVVKEWLFRYTQAAGRRIGSGALIANAWHHRSDAFSSVATLLGVGGAMFLGERGRVLDPVAQMIVAVFIVIVGVRMAMPAIRELLEVSLPEKVEDSICKTVSETPGVITFHHLRTRRNGRAIIIEVHLKVAPAITVREAHDISTEVERRLSELFSGDKSIITTHIEPYRGEKIYHDGQCAP